MASFGSYIWAPLNSLGGQGGQNVSPGAREAPLVYRKSRPRPHVFFHARAMFPLNDNIPPARFPIVTVALVEINVIV
jgi:hypothetical protein